MTLEELGIISKHIDKVLTDIGRDLRSGRIDADPFYKSPMDNACMYCDYKDACRFTDGQGNDQKRQITKLKTPEAMTLMRKECEEDGK